jgi:peptidoglycan/LPS O-acetylase OafA/YrhL
MNMFYVPRLFARPFIVVVAWTLAIEIQFYLVLVTAVGLAQRLGKRPVMGYPTAGYAVIFTLLALASLANLAGVVHFSMDLFLSHWMLFFLGVLGWWSVEGSVWRGWFWIYAALTAMTGGVHEGGDRLLIGLVAAVAIFIGGARGRLYDWWDAAPLQFLGRISYSLYLGHAIIGGKTVKLGHRLLGDSPVAAVGVFVLAFVVSIAGAYLMYVALERPSVRLAKRVKLKPAMTPPATEAAIPQERMASAAPEPDPAPAASASAAPVLPPAAQDAISANVIST